MRMLLIVGAMALVAPLLSAASTQPAPAFDPHAAAEALLASVPADARGRSDAYFEGGYWLRL
jgi:STE24 endopeptidase